MDIVHGEDELRRYMREAVEVSNDSPVLLDHFLDYAIEIDVDAISDGRQVIIAGVMEHIEDAGVHSGDSSCSLPPFSLDEELVVVIRRQTREMALALGVVGLLIVQFSVYCFAIYVREVNPCVSRTVPYVSKATGVDVVHVAARCMVGKTLVEQDMDKDQTSTFYSIKELVFPFIKFTGDEFIEW